MAKAPWSNVTALLTQVAAILIAGPTASGKSVLALRLARALGGVVINADSMQVYRDLRVLTGRPDREDEAKAPHRLFGHVDGAVNYSAGLWLASASAALNEARREERMPVFVGGTGLYIKVLTRGLSAIPPVPEDVGATVRSHAANVPAGDLPACPAIRHPRRVCGRAIRNAYCARSKSSRRPGKVSSLSMPRGPRRSSMRKTSSRYFSRPNESP